MPAVIIRDVPDETRNELAARAARSGRSWLTHQLWSLRWSTVVTSATGHWPNSGLARWPRQTCCPLRWRMSCADPEQAKIIGAARPDVW